MASATTTPGALGGTLLIVRRSLRHHALSSGVTVFAVALAAGLTMAVFSIQRQAEAAFAGEEIGFDAVVGARGSQLQLVLNTVFHLETSPGNIPWKLYDELRRDPRVATAIPYALGDNYFGHRLVGTSAELFHMQGESGREIYRLANTDPPGRWFDDKRMEAVLGSFVAERQGLSVGDTFSPYHGLTFDPEQRHNEQYTVVGILEPTNSPADRVIWIPIEGVFRMGGHVLRGTGEVYQAQAGREIPDENKEVSAVMLKLKNPQAGIMLAQTINKQGKVATMAWPIGAVMAELFNKLGWAYRVLELVAYLVVVVSVAAILASLYNTINERRREFAILRALGARKTHVFAAIVLEAAAIGSLGAIAGFAVYATILAVAAQLVHAQVGVVLNVFAIHPVLWWTPIGVIVASAAVGVVPAMKAYATDVATNLAPQS